MVKDDKIKILAKELCVKSGCHHKCQDITECVVMEEAAEILSRDTTIDELTILIRTGLAHNKSPKEIAEVIQQDGWQKQSLGEWQEALDGTHWCSVCGHDATYTFDGTEICGPACPFCGVKMKGNIKYE
jgi:hypothetical protein